MKNFRRNIKIDQTTQWLKKIPLRAEKLLTYYQWKVHMRPITLGLLLTLSLPTCSLANQDVENFKHLLRVLKTPI